MAVRTDHFALGNLFQQRYHSLDFCSCATDVQKLNSPHMIELHDAGRIFYSAIGTRDIFCFCYYFSDASSAVPMVLKPLFGVFMWHAALSSLLCCYLSDHSVVHRSDERLSQAIGTPVKHLSLFEHSLLLIKSAITERAGGQVDDTDPAVALGSASPRVVKQSRVVAG